MHRSFVVNSAVVAIALASVVGLPNTVVSAEPPNLVVNAGAEDGLTDWGNQFDRWEVIDVNPLAGSKSFRFGSYWGVLDQDLVIDAYATEIAAGTAEVTFGGSGTVGPDPSQEEGGICKLEAVVMFIHDASFLGFDSVEFEVGSGVAEHTARIPPDTNKIVFRLDATNRIHPSSDVTNPGCTILADSLFASIAPAESPAEVPEDTGPGGGLPATGSSELMLPIALTASFMIAIGATTTAIGRRRAYRSRR